MATADLPGYLIALINAGNVMVRRSLLGPDDITLFLVREVMDSLVFLLAGWILVLAAVDAE